ncbi:hypothetical protein [uncultured Thiodictyon sp.]|uniref:hypothetical protein n=1 Tax=uncultured Thiodictyon sp. TaxID=1846217 RepID=UPI0025ED9697|nr:hypothetical protein [uncultured Thiodictyon sp.]
MTTHRCLSARPLALGLLLTLAGTPALAGTYSVTSTADTNTAGTLRYAIDQANANPGSTINLQSSLGTITLGSMLPLLNASVTINGNGNTVSGGNQYRVFFAQQGTVSLNNLTIANGKAQGGNGGLSAGGGAGLGGGLFVNAAKVQLSGVQFTDNGAAGGSGGIFSGHAGGGGFYAAGGNGGGG